MNPTIGKYDYNLGISPEIINYIKESHIVQSRISPSRCYLLQRKKAGEVIDDGVGNYISVVSFGIDDGGYKYFTIWSGGDNFPDLRILDDENKGNIFVKIDNLDTVRLFDVADIVNNNEYVVLHRKTETPDRVDIVLNKNFDNNIHSVSYYYTTVNAKIDSGKNKPGSSVDKSFYGWQQYLNVPINDNLVGINQILVRTPLTREGFTVNEEGLVILKENQCWMIWEPYIYAGDLLIVPAAYSPNGRELRFNITDKQDSMIQGSLVSQKFRIVLLEETDPRYKLIYEIE